MAQKARLGLQRHELQALKTSLVDPQPALMTALMTVRATIRLGPVRSAGRKDPELEGYLSSGDTLQ